MTPFPPNVVPNEHFSTIISDAGKLLQITFSITKSMPSKITGKNIYFCQFK